MPESLLKYLFWKPRSSLKTIFLASFFKCFNDRFSFDLWRFNIWKQVLDDSFVELHVTRNKLWNVDVDYSFQQEPALNTFVWFIIALKSNTKLGFKYLITWTLKTLKKCSLTLLHQSRLLLVSTIEVFWSSSEQL